MLISIVIPAFNAEKYVAECLDSCMRQNVREDEYEVICVDDGATDRTGEILDEYARRYGNIRVIHQSNQGLPGARNTGLDAAKGEYVWFVDSDDIISANSLGTIFEKIRNTETRVDRYLVRVAEFTDAQEIRSGNVRGGAKHYYTEVWGSLFRRACLEQRNLRFHPKMYYGEDVLFSCEFEERENVTEALDILAYYYRFNPVSQQHAFRSTGVKLRKYISSYILGAKIIREHYENNPYNRSKKAFLLIYCLCCVYNETTMLPRAEEKAYLDELKRQGLFPMKKPDGLTERDMRLNLRTDLIGKIIRKIDNLIYFNCTTRIGYAILKIRNRLYRIYSSLK